MYHDTYVTIWYAYHRPSWFMMYRCIVTTLLHRISIVITCIIQVVFFGPWQGAWFFKNSNLRFNFHGLKKLWAIRYSLLSLWEVLHWGRVYIGFACFPIHLSYRWNMFKLSPCSLDLASNAHLSYSSLVIISM